MEEYKRKLGDHPIIVKNTLIREYTSVSLQFDSKKDGIGNRVVENASFHCIHPHLHSTTMNSWNERQNNEFGTITNSGNGE